MSETTRESLVMAPLPEGVSEIAPWLWAMGDVRRRTTESLVGITQAVLDWTPPVGGNAIGTLLYHIALIELDWLQTEVLEQPDFPPEVEALLPFDARDAQGRLTPCSGIALTEHLARLDAARARLLATFSTMSPDEFRRVRHLASYDVTPEWVLYHLLQHEAEHGGEIGLVRLLAERDLGGA